jgi:hypothetical protein
MFEFLSMFARWPFSRGTDSPSRFRKLETARGCYFVPWQPEVIKSLLATENLSADDLRESSRGDLHRLTRDLLLLGLQDEMETGRRSPIARFARSLIRHRHRGADVPSASHESLKALASASLQSREIEQIRVHEV